MKNQVQLPNIGDKIYLWTSNTGRKNIGGLATIKNFHVLEKPQNEINACFILTEETFSKRFNYKMLVAQQDKLKQEFGKQKAKTIL